MHNKIMNTIKISLAAIVAITIALFFELRFPVSAGTIAILTIMPTKRETVRTAIRRLLAFFIAIVIGGVCYEAVGYSVIGFIVFLPFFVLCCQCFSWNNALVMNAVLVSHFISFGRMNIESLTNEGLLFLIGVTAGIVANLHLRQQKGYMKYLKERMAKLVRGILVGLSEYVTMGGRDSCIESFQELSELIAETKSLAHSNYNNEFISPSSFDKEYIDMREKQYHVLYEMYRYTRRIKRATITADVISQFLLKMAEMYDTKEHSRELLEEFLELSDKMKKTPLPTERDEFEDRARLYILLRNIEEFIRLSMEFYEEKVYN